MAFERNFLLAALVLALLAPLAFHGEYVLHIGVMIMFSVMLATSFNLIVGYAGEFPLGHVAFFGIGAYTAALLSVKFAVPFHFTVPAAALVAAVFGLAIGAVTLRLRGPYFVIVTLCFAEVLRLVANNWVDLTNGPMGLSGIPAPAWAVGTGASPKLWFYFAGLLLATLSIVIAYRFVYSNVGRAAVALRENRYVAQSIGISPFYMGLVTFVLAAAISGVAGGFYAHYISYVGPEVFGFSFMISMIIMVLAGGKGTLAGPVVGAVIVVFLEEYLRDFKELRFSIFGLIVIGVVIFLPRGLMGFVTRRHERYERGMGAGGPAPEEASAGGVARKEAAEMLDVSGLTKRFGGLSALTDVSFSMGKGEIVSLIGPNGAGKTTCLNLITGFYKPSAGRVRYAGDDITGSAPYVIAQRGLVRTFQKTNVLRRLTVFGNVLTARYRYGERSLWCTFFGRRAGRERQLRDEAAALIEGVGLGARMNAEADSLSCGELRLLEVAVALGAGPRLLMLDEPAAGLNTREAEQLGRILKDLIGTHVESILLVEHNMALVMAISDRIVVLDFGRKIAEGAPVDVRANPAVIAAYLGKPAA